LVFTDALIDSAIKISQPRSFFSNYTKAIPKIMIMKQKALNQQNVKTI